MKELLATPATPATDMSYTIAPPCDRLGPIYSYLASCLARRMPRHRATAIASLISEINPTKGEA